MTTVDARPPAVTSTHRASGGGGVLTGTGTVVRFILRRDRIKLPAWILGITVLLFYYGAALPEVLDEGGLAGIATLMDGPVGALIAGPGYGSENITLERAIVGVYGIYFLLLAALMNMLLVSRHTRVEEQTGRAELVRASVLGRHAPLTAVLIVAVGANVLLALLLGGAAAANDFDGGQGLLFGAGVGAVGLVFAGITALTVQITEYSRAATGFAGLALGAFWAIRAAGDMLGEHGSPLSWFSPLAWSQQTRPFVDGRWWPLALSVALAVAAAAAGYALAARRDLGAGMVAARRGSSGAAPWLASPLAFAFRLHRTSLIVWTVVLSVSMFLFAWITDQMTDFYEEAGDDLIAVMGGDPDRLFDGYLWTLSLTTALLISVMVILGSQSLRAEETRGRAEPVLATATSRWAYLGGTVVVQAAGVTLAMLVIGLAGGAGAAISLGDAGYVWDIALAHLSYVPPVLVLLAIAALLFGVWPRAIGATWAVLGYGLFIGFFGALMELPQLFYNLSPFEHVPAIPLEDFHLPPVVILIAIAAVLTAAGLVAFRRRDLETK